MNISSFLLFFMATSAMKHAGIPEARAASHQSKCPKGMASTTKKIGDIDP